MDFPSTCYKDPFRGGDPHPCRAAVPFILHNKQKQLMFWPVKRRYLHDSTHQNGTLAGIGRLSRFPYKAQESRGGLPKISNSSSTMSSAALTMKWV